MKILFYNQDGKPVETQLFSIRHIRNQNHPISGGSTVLMPHDKNKLFISYCAPKDHFCRKRGILMALQKYIWWRFKELYPNKTGGFDEPIILDFMAQNNEMHIILVADSLKCEDKDKFWWLHQNMGNPFCSLDKFLDFHFGGGNLVHESS